MKNKSSGKNCKSSTTPSSDNSYFIIGKINNNVSNTSSSYSSTNLKANASVSNIFSRNHVTQTYFFLFCRNEFKTL